MTNREGTATPEERAADEQSFRAVLQAMRDTQVSFATRLRGDLKLRLDRYIAWRTDPSARKADVVQEWPETYQGVVNDALDNWLAEHSPQSHTAHGVKPKPSVLQDRLDENPDSAAAPARPMARKLQPKRKSEDD